MLRIQPNLEQLENSVRLAGHVFQPGPAQWFEGMRLRDLLPSPELVKPLADLSYVLIRREISPNVDIAVLSADLQRAWLQPASDANVALRPRDTVYVFSVEEEDRGRRVLTEMPFALRLDSRALLRCDCVRWGRRSTLWG